MSRETLPDQTLCGICKEKKDGVIVGPCDGYKYCPECWEAMKEAERDEYALFSRFGSGSAILVNRR